MPSTVYVIEHGEYEDRCISGIAASLDAAVKFVKTTYSSPYIVRWEELVHRESGKSEYWTLSGNFSAVQGYSIEHKGEFDITPWVVSE